MKLKYKPQMQKHLQNCVKMVGGEWGGKRYLREGGHFWEEFDMIDMTVMT